tara:strand:+ start:682 stop:927 length:246 start_codon:yes stop_codon:yes gene_type:complete
MQKIVNVLAIASFAVSGAVVVSGLYVYVNRSSIIDGIKSQALEAVLGGSGGIPGVGGDALPDLAPDTKAAPMALPTPNVPL